MAQQHFYTRVPARMSLYNRMDGYDTFAVSEGVSRTLIEGELAGVYDVQPTKEDAALIQKGALPTLYAQFTTASGTLVQSAVSFSDADYTGERTSYLVHSLILSEEEKAACLNSLTKAPFDPEIFKKDLEGFDLTAASARPLTEYPTLPVKPKDAPDRESIVEQYDTGMLKRLIYSMLGIACGKTKALFLALPAPLASFSEECLNFLNTVIGIFPYHLRPALSFVTYAGDITKYSSFKIRCIAENTPAIPNAKGVCLKMGLKDYSGISDANIAESASIVDFFYSLFTEDALRREFILFCDAAVKADEALFSKPSMKNLGDLVFLFRALCGFYEEKQVLPNDDAVLNFIVTYDKNRHAVPDEYRIRAMQCLNRYAEEQTAIPKNIFAKVSTLYPGEPAASRRVVMKVVLSLIHTDAMRDKLFGFLKSNYPTAAEEEKAAIAANLCRVYYGGFLQKQLLEFFRENFLSASAETRELILERLLLTVRTPAVQGAVLDFVSAFYEKLTEAEKDRFYDTYFEMLPEADALTRLLSDVVDANIEEERKEAFAEKLLHFVDLDDKHKEPRLCEALCTKCGFVESLIASRAFTSWEKREILPRFVAAMAQKAPADQIATVAEIWRAAPEMSGTAADRLFDALKSAPASKAGIFRIAESMEALRALASEIPASADFCRRYEAEILEPQAVAALYTAFDVKRYPDGLDRLTELAAAHPAWQEAPEFAPVKAYTDGLSAVRSCEGARALEAFLKIEQKPLRLGAADQLKAAADSLTGEKALLAAVMVEYLKTDEIRFSLGADTVKSALMQSAASGTTEEIALHADETTSNMVLTLAADLFSAAVPDQLKAALTSSSSDLAAYLRSYLGRHDKKGKKYLSSLLATLDPAFAAAAGKLLDAKPASSGGLFSKLFKK